MVEKLGQTEQKNPNKAFTKQKSAFNPYKRPDITELSKAIKPMVRRKEALEDGRLIK